MLNPKELKSKGLLKIKKKGKYFNKLNLKKIESK